MGRSTPSGRALPILVPLLGLLLPLLTAVGWTAFNKTNEERSMVTQAEAVAVEARRQQAVVAFIAPAQIERSLLERLARIHATAPEAISTATYQTIREQADTTKIEVDAAFDRLRDNFKQPDTAATAPPLVTLTETQAAIAAARAAVAAGGADPENVNAAFRQGNANLAVLSRTSDITAQPTPPSSPVLQMRLLSEVILTAGDYGEFLTAAIATGEHPQYAQARIVLIEHDTLFSVFLEAAPTELEQVTELQALADSVTIDADRDRVGGAVLQVSDPNGPRLTGDYSFYLSELNDYAAEFNQRIVTAHESSVATARISARRWQTGMFVMLSLTGLVTAMMLFTIVRPLRTLRERAIAISQGRLDGPALPEHGSSELRSLTKSMNDTSETLRLVGRELEHLANGEIDTERAVTLPGGFGDSLRRSLERVGIMASRLRHSERLSHAVIAGAADAIWTVDEHGNVVSANRASETMTGIEVDNQVGTPIGSLISARHGEATVIPDSQHRKVLVTSSQVIEGDTRLDVIIAHDITERARFERELEHHASHDALTGLPNRRAVLDRIDGYVACTTASVAILFLDLDSFKAVNDTMGHGTGDEVLRTTAAAIQTCAIQHAPNALVGRLGGDEFIVVIDGVDNMDWLADVADNLIAATENGVHDVNRTISISASVGATIGKFGDTATDLLRQADSALYQAKRSGKGQVQVFNASLQRTLEREAELEMALRSAVRSEAVHFELQPIVNTSDEQVVAAEMLARWHHATLGHVPPDEFIPIAERSSLIIDIQRQMLGHAGRLLADWSERFPGQRRRIAVNISGRHISDGSLVDDIDNVVARYGLDPSLLEIELTESLLLDELSDDVINALLDLRRRGVRVAVDDLGTGYSSMSYLRSLPIDAIKIDRSFVARSLDQGFDTTVITALVTVGHALGLEVVAEGVETLAQRNLVGDLNCEYVQGYFVSRPTSPDEAEALLFAS